MSGALTIFEHGDVTITWSSDRDEAMAEIIRKKMAEGMVFWIIEPRGARRRLEEFDEAKKYRRLAIPDEDFEKFVSEGNGQLVPTPAAPVRSSRRSKDAGEIARSESIGHRPARGG